MRFFRMLETFSLLVHNRDRFSLRFIIHYGKYNCDQKYEIEFEM